MRSDNLIIVRLRSKGRLSKHRHSGRTCPRTVEDECFEGRLSVCFKQRLAKQTDQTQQRQVNNYRLA